MTRDCKTGRHDYLILAGILLLALILRVWGLNASLWYDEIATWVQIIDSSLLDIIASYPSNNNHPFFSFFAKISLNIFGASEWAFRLPAALFGIASVPVAYLFARNVVSRPEALATAAIMALSYHLIWFSQNARGYTMMLVFALICTLTLNCAVKGSERTKSYYTIYAVSLTLAAYTHLTMVLFGIAQAICVLGYYVLSQPFRQLPKAFFPASFTFLGAAFVTIILYSPMIGDVINFFLKDASITTNSTSTTVANPAWALTAAISELSIALGGIVPLIVVTLLLITGGINLLVHRPFLTFLVILPVPVIVVATLLLDRPIFPRFFFFLSGFLVLTAINGLWLVSHYLAKTIRRPKLGSVGFGTIVLASCLYMVTELPRIYQIPKQDYEAAAEKINILAVEGNTYVIGITAELPFNQYLGLTLQPIQTVVDLQHVQSTEETFFLAYTFEKYIKIDLPDIWQTIHKICTEKTRFASSVGGGELIIMQCGLM